MEIWKTFENLGKKGKFRKKLDILKSWKNSENLENLEKFGNLEKIGNFEIWKES